MDSDLPATPGQITNVLPFTFTDSVAYGSVYPLACTSALEQHGPAGAFHLRPSAKYLVNLGKKLIESCFGHRLYADDDDDDYAPDPQAVDPQPESSTLIAAALRRESLTCPPEVDCLVQTANELGTLMTSRAFSRRCPNTGKSGCPFRSLSRQHFLFHVQEGHWCTYHNPTSGVSAPARKCVLCLEKSKRSEGPSAKAKLFTSDADYDIHLRRTHGTSILKTGSLKFGTAPRGASNAHVHTANSCPRCGYSPKDFHLLKRHVRRCVTQLEGDLGITVLAAESATFPQPTGLCTLWWPQTNLPRPLHGRLRWQVSQPPASNPIVTSSWKSDGRTGPSPLQALPPSLSAVPEEPKVNAFTLSKPPMEKVPKRVIIQPFNGTKKLVVTLATSAASSNSQTPLAALQASVVLSTATATTTTSTLTPSPAFFQHSISPPLQSVKRSHQGGLIKLDAGNKLRRLDNVHGSTAPQQDEPVVIIDDVDEIENENVENNDETFFEALFVLDGAPKSGSDSIACELCEETCLSRRELLLHLRKAHRQEWRDEVETFKGEVLLGVAPHRRCADCGMQFYTHAGLRQHRTPPFEKEATRRNEALNERCPLGRQCEECQRPIPVRELYRHYQHTHKDAFERVMRSRVCLLCCNSPEQATIFNMEQHLRIYHAPSWCPVVEEEGVPGQEDDEEGVDVKMGMTPGATTPYHCPQCVLCFTTDKERREHIVRRHHVFRCPFCTSLVAGGKKGKRSATEFIDSVELQRHTFLKHRGTSANEMNLCSRYAEATLKEPKGGRVKPRVVVMKTGVRQKSTALVKPTSTPVMDPLGTEENKWDEGLAGVEDWPMLCHSGWRVCPLCRASVEGKAQYQTHWMNKHAISSSNNRLTRKSNL